MPVFIVHNSEASQALNLPAELTAKFTEIVAHRKKEYYFIMILK